MFLLISDLCLIVVIKSILHTDRMSFPINLNCYRYNLLSILVLGNKGIQENLLLEV